MSKLLVLLFPGHHPLIIFIYSYNDYFHFKSWIAYSYDKGMSVYCYSLDCSKLNARPRSAWLNSSQIILHDSVKEVQFCSEVEIPVLRKIARFTKEEWDGKGLGEEAKKLLNYKAGRKRWAKLEFLGKSVCGHNADKGGRFCPGYLSERSKIQAKEGNAVIFG